MWHLEMELSENNYNYILSEVKKHLEGHDKRIIHILGVVKLSEELAKKYNVDPIKAKIAAVLHDYSKYDDNIDVLDNDEKKEAEKYPYLAHGYLSAYEAKNKFGITDIDIINAIKNHVVGRRGMSRLEEIVFIADFCEENRTYEDCIKAREILKNKGIDEAILYSCESSIKHSSSAHPNQLELLKIYKEKINA